MFPRHPHGLAREQDTSQEGVVNLAHEGGGCWHCGVNTPVVWLDLRHGREGLAQTPFTRPYALCLPCLGFWFPGWSGDRVYDWLERQAACRVSWEREKPLREDADKRDLAAWLAGVIQ